MILVSSSVYALVVAILFWIIFKDNKENSSASSKQLLEAESDDAGGMTIDKI